MNKTILHYFVDSKKWQNKSEAIMVKISGQWKSFTWKQKFQYSDAFGKALMALSVDKGDKVALLANTCFEWTVADLAIMGIGGITVPLYQSLLPEELIFILNDSRTTTLICEDKSLVEKWNSIKDKCPLVKNIIVINNYKGQKEDIHSYKELIKTHRKIKDDSFIESCKATTSDDIATIIYTSGTTGQPKGVVLKHKQIISEITAVFNSVDLKVGDRTLCFLPLAHVLGRIESLGQLYTGYTIAFAESIDKIRKNLKEVHPTVIIAVPRIFEKIYNGVLAQAESSPYKSKLFNWAISVGKEYSRYTKEKKNIPFILLAQYITAKKLVFSNLQKSLGGNLKFAICGGAPLSKEIAEFFHAADFLILEGYGLTETTAAITLNTQLDYEFGTVGKPLPNVIIKIAEDGEILIKSDNVMKEYYNNNEATAEVFQDDYFATGDIGEFNSEGFLKITDRKKDLIKTAGGKYVAPQKLENLLKNSQYISNVLIHGDQKKYVVALITLDELSIQNYAANKHISYSNLTDLAQSTEVKELIRKTIANTNSQLSGFESIKNFSILDKDFTVESGELTPSLKVKRKVCDNRYKPVIDKMYGIDKSSL